MGSWRNVVPFIVAELGPDADPFMLHLYAALAQKKRHPIPSAPICLAASPGVLFTNCGPLMI